ncbi:TNF receptor-associated factor 3-like [Montipora capricornis]|uniref:TNF receptor-associated factor 3-like n=1 Tax=Montipora capricornis TaxID=246305 RepID=UPI0035F1348A
MVNFVNNPDERLTCPICKTVFNEPWQTSCGHRFCKLCLESLFRRTKLRCPVDGNQISQEESFHDKCCEREILDLQCSCQYKDRNCDWKGEFRNLKAHETCCQYGDVQCLACSETMERRRLKDHASNSCINRAVMCTYCGGKVRQKKLKDHFDFCLKFPVKCHLLCGKDTIPRDMLDEHMTKECPHAEVSCPFFIHGCEFKGKKESVDEHLKASIKIHVEKMNQTSIENRRKYAQIEETIDHLQKEKNNLEQQLLNQTEELAAAKINIQIQQTKISLIERSTNGQISDLKKLRRDLDVAAADEGNGTVFSSQIDEILKIVREHETMVDNLQSELAFVKEITLSSKDNGKRPRSLSDYHTTCERRMERNENQLALHEIQLSEQNLQIQMLEATSYTGVYLWKIDQYSRRFQEAVSGKTISIYSPPFYVGRFGYKVCARLYPNGDGMGKGTHVSVFFVIMRGEYDALLTWPFLQKVHFRIIDQDKIRDASDTFRPDPNSSSFKKPTSDMNVASGCPTLLSHQERRQGGFVRDDTMYVKVNVDMRDLQGDLWTS